MLLPLCPQRIAHQIITSLQYPTQSGGYAMRIAP